MSTPHQLLKIAESNHIVKRFLHSWLHGQVELDVMLLSLAKELEKQCNDMIDKYELRDVIKDSLPPFLPNYVLEETLIPDLSEVKNPLLRQEKLISAICLINEFYKNIMQMCVKRAQYNLPILVVTDKSLFTSKDNIL